MPENKCFNCSKIGEDVTLGPDPCMAEMHSDFTEVWECEKCRIESALDV